MSKLNLPWAHASVETAESNEALEKTENVYQPSLDKYSQPRPAVGAANRCAELICGLTSDGSRPSPSGRDAWLQLAEQVVRGDAQAVAAGYTAVAEPSAAELQAILNSAIAETNDVVAADRTYDKAQATLWRLSAQSG
ncbi:MAG: hypothetical protein R3E31_21155 [Chloroflexota bacterium]